MVIELDSRVAARSKKKIEREISIFRGQAALQVDQF